MSVLQDGLMTAFIVLLLCWLYWRWWALSCLILSHVCACVYTWGAMEYTDNREEVRQTEEQKWPRIWSGLEWCLWYSIIRTIIIIRFDILSANNTYRPLIYHVFPIKHAYPVTVAVWFHKSYLFFIRCTLRCDSVHMWDILRVAAVFLQYIKNTSCVTERDTLVYDIWGFISSIKCHFLLHYY